MITLTKQTRGILKSVEYAKRPNGRLCQNKRVKT